MLSACLALVKPVGMGNEDAQAWLRVAAGELAHLPPDMLAKGCATARQTCTHHGQIVPTILKDVAEWYSDVREGHRIAERRAKATEALPPPTETQAAIGQLVNGAAKALTAF